MYANNPYVQKPVEAMIHKEIVREEVTDYRNIATDALRELEKVTEVLYAADRHFQAMGEANAALHMNDRVILNPLAAAISTALAGASRAIDRLVLALDGQEPLPFDDPKPWQQPVEVMSFAEEHPLISFPQESPFD